MIVREQITRYERDNYFPFDGYEENEKVSTGLSTDIISYGYRDKIEVGPGSWRMGPWLKRAKPAESAPTPGVKELSQHILDQLPPGAAKRDWVLPDAENLPQEVLDYYAKCVKEEYPESARASREDARELADKIRAVETVDTGIGTMEEYRLDEAEAAAEIERYAKLRLAQTREREGALREPWQYGKPESEGLYLVELQSLRLPNPWYETGYWKRGEWSLPINTGDDAKVVAWMPIPARAALAREEGKCKEEKDES